MCFSFMCPCTKLVTFMSNSEYAVMLSFERNQILRTIKIVFANVVAT